MVAPKIIPTAFRTIESVSRRYAAYLNATIPDAIAENDDMLGARTPDALEHYFSVGRSAIEVIARAMIAADTSRVSTVLDLPCGYGRIARHLTAFFPEAELFVGEIQPEKERFCAQTFGATIIGGDRQFREPPQRQFDLIFVGSLLTHFDAKTFERALDWFIAALAPQGVLIATTHGRRHVHLEGEVNRFLPPERWRTMRDSYEASGFGYSPDSPGSEIGMTLSAPSWIARRIERKPSVRLVGIQESGWVEAQDVLVLRKRPIAA